MFLSLVIAAALILGFMAPCQGTGRVVVTLKSYKNPSHRMSNGKCCDHLVFNFGRCYPCDAYFKLCVTQSASGSAHNCNIGRSQTGVVGDNDNHYFHIRREFSFNSFQGTITIGVDVWDKDKYTSDDFVEGTYITVPSLRPGTSHHPLRKKLTLTASRITVGLELELFCDRNYYGDACNVKCVPRDDPSGHYNCDHQGRKVCKPGWYGSSCTKYCVPRDDPHNGHFNCDKDGNKICLRNWQGPSCKSCVKNWFGSRCVTYCVPQDNDALGHYKCRPADGKKQCLPSWFGSECRTQCIPRDDDGGHYTCADDGSKTCIHGWHGENCTVYCVPQDDDELGHYACDNDGNKVCFDGFHGFTANCSLTCLPENRTSFVEFQYKCTDNGVKVCNPWWFGPDCTEYCVPHNDTIHGHYTCDPRDGSKVCLKGWQGRDCLHPRQIWKFKIN